MKTKWIFETLKYIFFFIFLTGLGSVLFLSRAWTQILPRMHVGEPSAELYLKEVLPDFDNVPAEDSFFVEEKRVYPGFRILKKEDARGRVHESYEVSGFAFVTSGPGYGKKIDLLVGVSPSGEVTGVRLTALKEPQGFGEVFVQQKYFFDSLKGQPLKGLSLAGEGGEIQAVTSATVTSRSVVTRAYEAADFFLKNREVFMKRLPPYVLESMGKEEPAPAPGGLQEISVAEAAAQEI